GISSHASVDYLVPNRFEDGYGLSPEVVERAAARGAELIVTVDNGISSHASVDYLVPNRFEDGYGLSPE
ncbi:hypothetical protein SJZ82_24980, partial [Serratia marcescens]|uniref:hypothetical protein n=1 Tax=Serratia marcescens TaxID=615 RepID=UPI0029DDDA36